jgi:hypothetical protein
MEKYFEEIEYDLSIKNPTSRVSARDAGGPSRQEAMTRADYQEA